MPLQQVTNSARLRNKQNASQADPQSSFQNSPIKPSLQNGLSKNSPYKKSVSNQITQLKIRLSDRQFELKKLQQDCTVKLALMQKQLVKQKNEKKAIIKQSKEKLDEDRQYFETKIKMLEQGWKKKQKQIQQYTKNIKQQNSKKQLAQIKLSYQNRLKLKEQQIQKLKIQFENQKLSLQTNHKNELLKNQVMKKSLIQQIQKKNQQEINQLRQLHLAQVQFYQQVEGQKLKQNNVVVKILSDKIRATEEQLRTVKENMKQLNRQLQKKEEELTLERRAKQEYRLDKVYLQRKLTRLQPDIREKYQKELQLTKNSYLSSLQQHKNTFLLQISALKSLHQQATQQYKQQLSQMQERCRQVSYLHQTIKSNEDDIKKIQILEMKLIKKQMQLEKQREDVKMCKLQLSNMDQIFHKMFEEAKLKSLRPKRHRLPSLLSVGQNRSTMDVYNSNATEQVKQKKKFSIRELNYPSINKTKDIKELSSQFIPYQN